ncbi:MAG: phosphoribosylglycinamide synthetase C domain-containing protein, partial [Nitrospinota bacterium]
DREIIDTIMKPLIAGMKNEGKPYKGILYGGLMIVGDKPFVLEFNCRFGDPETQPVLARMKSDIVPVMIAVVDGKLNEMEIQWYDEASVCVVMAMRGYPDTYEKGMEIKGLGDIKKLDNLMVFHAGTIKNDGKTLTNGGRVLGITSLGKDIKDAIDKAYKGVNLISWKGVYYRRDIGGKALQSYTNRSK